MRQRKRKLYRCFLARTYYWHAEEVWQGFFYNRSFNRQHIQRKK